MINVYAHAGNVNDREDLFNHDLLYYMRNNLDNTIIVGDWNCVASQRDTQSKNAQISKSLLNLVRNVKFKDIWFINNKVIDSLLLEKI